MPTSTPPVPGGEKPKEEAAKKPSFWEKLSEKQKVSERASGAKSSLVNAIVRQAEKEAGEAKKPQLVTPKSETGTDEREQARNLFGTARTLLNFVVILSVGVGLYFYAMLDAGNYFHGKLGRQNLTVQANYKTELLAQLETDYTDTQKFSKLLRVEGLANRILELDLENPILNYERPSGEKVNPRSGGIGTLLKTVNENGEVIYLAEAEILKLENSREIRKEFAKNSLFEILEEAKNLVDTTKTDPQIEKDLSDTILILGAVDPEEKNFPSAVLKARFAAVQSLARSILMKVKDLNLKNLVVDIKKQAQTIDVSAADTETQTIIAELQNIAKKISEQRPSSFDEAIKAAEKLSLGKITDHEIYQKVIRIIGDPANKNDGGDLAAAGIIAKNLGKVNTINALAADKIEWSKIVDRVEKIARLGSDLERDVGGIPLDASKDIDPNGKLVAFGGYSGKSSKSEIEIRGNVLGSTPYQNQNFTLLADLIDAFEGSKYFQDVEGFSFSKSTDRDGKITAPLSFKLKIQNPSAADERDVEIATTETETDTLELDIDLDEIRELNFSLQSGNAATTENEFEEDAAENGEMAEAVDIEDEENEEVDAADAENLSAAEGVDTAEEASASQI